MPRWKQSHRNTHDRLRFWIDQYSTMDFGIWIECTLCKKWRKNYEYSEPHEVPENWHCSMGTTDGNEKGNCNEPEVEFNEEYFDHYPGSLVWAKLDGFPWWPAMVDEDPDVEEYFWKEKNDEPYYNVTFLDDHVSRAWVSTRYLSSFHVPPPRTRFLNRGSKSKYSAAVLKAQERAKAALCLPLKDRLKTYSFLYTYKGKWSSAANYDREESLLDITDSLMQEVDDLDDIFLSDTSMDGMETNCKNQPEEKNNNSSQVVDEKQLLNLKHVSVKTPPSQIENLNNGVKRFKVTKAPPKNLKKAPTLISTKMAAPKKTGVSKKLNLNKVSSQQAPTLTSKKNTASLTSTQDSNLPPPNSAENKKTDSTAISSQSTPTLTLDDEKSGFLTSTQNLELSSSNLKNSEIELSSSTGQTKNKVDPTESKIVSDSSFQNISEVEYASVVNGISEEVKSENSEKEDISKEEHLSVANVNGDVKLEDTSELFTPTYPDSALTTNVSNRSTQPTKKTVPVKPSLQKIVQEKNGNETVYKKSKLVAKVKENFETRENNKRNQPTGGVEKENIKKISKNTSGLNGKIIIGKDSDLVVNGNTSEFLENSVSTSVKTNGVLQVTNKSITNVSGAKHSKPKTPLQNKTKSDSAKNILNCSLSPILSTEISGHAQKKIKLANPGSNSKIETKVQPNVQKPKLAAIVKSKNVEKQRKLQKLNGMLKRSMDQLDDNDDDLLLEDKNDKRKSDEKHLHLTENGANDKYAVSFEMNSSHTKVKPLFKPFKMPLKSEGADKMSHKPEVKAVQNGNVLPSKIKNIGNSTGARVKTTKKKEHNGGFFMEVESPRRVKGKFGEVKEEERNGSVDKKAVIDDSFFCISISDDEAEN